MGLCHAAKQWYNPSCFIKKSYDTYYKNLSFRTLCEESQNKLEYYNENRNRAIDNRWHNERA